MMRTFLGSSNTGGFASGLLLGFFISLIWVPCGGPILAAAIIQTAVQKTTFQSFLTFFAFALGSAIPMLIIALVGRNLVHGLDFFKKHAVILRKFFGVVIIISAIIAAFAGNLTGYISMPAAPNVVVPMDSNSINEQNKLINGLTRPYVAPAIKNDSTWINSPPLTLDELKGKVVLIDFWTYSCINCIRTLPYLKSWDEKYKDKGLVIIGVHTPEFEFEKNVDNVKKAVTQFGINYPVVLDSSYGTWMNYNNHYWPAHYLIDKKGYVVYEHFGEGNYAETEHNIQVLLGLTTSSSTTPIDNSTLNLQQQTPETYLGYARAGNFYNVEPLALNQTINFTFPDKLPQNDWSLQGDWYIEAEKITSASPNASIRIHFNAAKVYVVMGNTSITPIPIKVLLNDQAVGEYAGKDVKNDVVVLAEYRLYEVASFHQPTRGILS